MLKERRNKYFNLVNEQSISVFYSGVAPHLSADSYYPFYVNKNFWYLSGINQANSYLVLIKGTTENQVYLFLEKQDPQLALWVGESLSFEKASKLSEVNLTNILDVNDFNNFITTLLTSSRKSIFGNLNEIYFDFDRQNYDDLPSKTEILSNDFKSKFSYLKISNNHPFLVELRKTKDEHELLAIKEAINISNLANTHLLNTLKSAKNEADVLAEFNYILNKNQTIPSFDPIVAGGKNATVLHYVDNNSNLNKEDLILLDLGVKYNEYASDITRTYPLSGKYSKRQKEVYEAVLSVNKEIIEWVKPGITLKEYNEKGRELLIKAAKKINLIKEDHEISKYYYHSLGHLLGLDVHDVTNPLIPLAKGDVITVEPGLYISEENIGVRIEDDLYITEDGCINLSKDIIKEVKDIENFLKDSK